MIQLADINTCTGCGACSFVCKKQAIRLAANKIGIVLPEISHDACVGCGMCVKVCPALNPAQKNYPMESLAAWHNDTSERLLSASGAIAAAAYHEALAQGMSIAGAKQNEDFSVDVVISDRIETIADFRNSKYVFSSITKLLPQLADNIKAGKKTLVIALPCQIAAIRKCFPRNQDKLVLADVVCHGCTPTTYLQQHIARLETELGIKAAKMSFRAPEAYTYTFTFTLSDKHGNIYYAKRTKDGDTYQYAYHRVVSYRENCFHCQYARPERVGDFSLCDYYGLGQKIPFEYNHLNASCILINTNTGKEFLKPLIENSAIVAFKRPVDEAINGNRQLQKPCDKSRSRIEFEKQIQKYEGNFEKAITLVMRHEEKRRTFSKLLNLPKIIVKRILNHA